MLTQLRLSHDLARLGVASGDLVMVHASLRAVGLVEGGGDTVIRALLDALGPAGTLVAGGSRLAWNAMPPGATRPRVLRALRSLRGWQGCRGSWSART